MADTPKPMQGTWTLTAPDGRTWSGGSPIRCAAAEQRERVPAEVALQRIFDAASEDALTAAPSALARHRFWGAGEPDCPQDLKAPNGELHTTRCKVCGDGWRKSVDVCFGAAPAAQPADSAMEVLRELVEALENYATFPPSIKAAFDRARTLTAASKERSKTHE